MFVSGAYGTETTSLFKHHQQLSPQPCVLGGLFDIYTALLLPNIHTQQPPYNFHFEIESTRPVSQITQSGIIDVVQYDIQVHTGCLGECDIKIPQTSNIHTPTIVAFQKRKSKHQ